MVEHEGGSYLGYRAGTSYLFEISNQSVLPEPRRVHCQI